MVQRSKSKMPLSACKPTTPPPELIRFGHSNFEFNSCKSFGTATPFPLNCASTLVIPLPSPTNDKFYCVLSPITTPDSIKNCCAICHLHQTRHIHSSASSKRFVPVVSIPVLVLQGSVVFHEACLFAYLLSDNEVAGLTGEFYEELRELRKWVIAQKWDWAVLGEVLDRVLTKAGKRMVEAEEAVEAERYGEMVELGNGCYVV
ncbi:hypothetical protein BKA58DRAFT_376350 [Alternaria rosae]|uniref:uncharacterized protein n=1 Tax=Alternaria rosae TaxID=1187941 RepID=UPI001E8E63F8|nr:uncharacterized protein BKA58DRAFT_376350 [Alternaria rosae]KAH6878016.1 hypothetical protein BKA58DRAFT_376350 [Alternaria rosae]